MIYSIGTDTFDIKRLIKMAEDKEGFSSFVKHTYTKAEQALSLENFKSGLLHTDNMSGEFNLKDVFETDEKTLVFALLFSAKEAVFKALNLSGNTPFHWSDIEILPKESNFYNVKLFGLLDEHAKAVGLKSIKLDISLDDNMILSGAITEI